MDPEASKQNPTAPDTVSGAAHLAQEAGQDPVVDSAIDVLLSSSINRPCSAPLKLLLHEIDEHGSTNGSGARVGDQILAKASHIGIEVQAQAAPPFEPHRTAGDDHARHIEAITDYSRMTTRRLAEAFVEQRESGAPIVSVGGNHNRAIELAAYFAECALRGKEPVIVWVDAHPDIHTPVTTESGNVHGMVASLTLRGGPEELVQLLNDYPALKPENLIYLGLNAVDERELGNLKHAGVPAENVISMMDVVLRSGMSRWTDRVNAIHERLGDRALWWCEVDVDVLHQKETSGADMDNTFGLMQREVKAALIHLTQSVSLGGLGISEISKNASEDMIEFASDLALVMCGIVNRPYAVHMDYNEIGRSEELSEGPGAASALSDSLSYLKRAGAFFRRHARDVAAAGALIAASVSALFDRGAPLELPTDPLSTRPIPMLSKGEDRQFAFTGVHSSNRFAPLPYKGVSMYSVDTLIQLAGEYVSSETSLHPRHRDRVLSCLYAAELNGGNQEHWNALKGFLTRQGTGGKKLFFDLSVEYDAFKQGIDRAEVADYLTLWDA